MNLPLSITSNTNVFIVRLLPLGVNPQYKAIEYNAIFHNSLSKLYNRLDTILLWL